MRSSRIQELQVASITVDDAVWRGRRDMAAIADFCEAAQAGDVFPPVTVFSPDGKCFWLADGGHTLEMCRRLGRDAVQARVLKGGKREAILYSAGANVTHGVRRTNEDKRKAIRSILEDAEWDLWSNAEVARTCGVSPGLVASVRESMRPEPPPATAPGPSRFAHPSPAQRKTAKGEAPPIRHRPAQAATVQNRRSSPIDEALKLLNEAIDSRDWYAVIEARRVLEVGRATAVSAN